MWWKAELRVEEVVHQEDGEEIVVAHCDSLTVPIGGAKPMCSSGPQLRFVKVMLKAAAATGLRAGDIFGAWGLAGAAPVTRVSDSEPELAFSESEL